MARLLGLLVGFMFACNGGDGSTAAGSTTGMTGMTGTSGTTSTPTSSTAATGGEIDCAAKNACLLYPDVCEGVCACDMVAFADAICVTTENGEYLTRCNGGVGGVSALCPYGCSGVGSDNQAHCRPPLETCGIDTPCVEAEPGCTQCACTSSGNSFGCAGKLVVEYKKDAEFNDFCQVIEYCGFGCEANKCCLDRLCEPPGGG